MYIVYNNINNFDFYIKKKMKKTKFNLLTLNIYFKKEFYFPEILNNIYTRLRT